MKGTIFTNKEQFLAAFGSDVAINKFDVQDVEIDFNVDSIYDLVPSKYIEIDKEDKRAIVKVQYDWGNLRFKKQITINNTKFNSSFNFYGCTFTGCICFENCEFNDIKFSSNLFNSGLGFTNCEFNGDYGMSFSHFKKEDLYGREGFYFSKCKFHGSFKFAAGVIEKVDVAISAFEETLFFEGFEDCTFSKEANFRNIKFKVQEWFFDCEFKDIVSFIQCSFEIVSFTHLRCNKGIHFSNSTFNDDVIFSGINLPDVDSTSYFNKCGFLNNTRFINFVLSSNINFSNSFAESTFTFGEMTSEGIKIIDVKTKLIFKNFKIANNSVVKIHINTKDTQGGEIDFENALIQGLLDIQNANVNRISFTGAVISGQLNDGNTPKNPNDRQTARLLKHEALKSHNTILSLNYKAIEMKKYRAELKGTNRYSEKFILRLNTISNNNGLRWDIGIVFTLLSAIIFHSLYALSINEYSFGGNPMQWVILTSDFWKEILNFLWLPSGFKELDNEKSTVLSSFLYILGKILIGYGIYQTISAFRKYGGKS